MDNAASRADEIYQALLLEIISGGLSKGGLLLEAPVADRFRVSKVTSREALQRLCEGGYLTAYPRKGYMINEITAQQLRMMQQVRYQVEAFAIREAIRKASDDSLRALSVMLERFLWGQEGVDAQAKRDNSAVFTLQLHMEIAKLSGNPYVVATMNTSLAPICRYASINMYLGGQGQGQFEDNHHAELIEAMQNRDAPAALEWLLHDLKLSPEEV